MHLVRPRAPVGSTRQVSALLAAALALSLAAPALAQPAPPTPAPATASAGATPLATPGAAPAPSAQTDQVSAPPKGEASPEWVVNFEPATLYAEASDTSELLAPLRQFTYLQVLGYEDTWARVSNPRIKATGYIPSNVLGPVAEAPPAYLAAPPPPAVEAVNRPGRVVGGAVLALYPTPDADAQVSRLGHNAPVQIAESVLGEDGESWYRTAEGDYLPASAVRLPRPPPRTFAGRWIDADLAEPAMLTAYEGDRPVMASLVIKGLVAYRTPQGVFAIQRRVANETMDSATIGIPRTAPGGYYLKNVLFTQYFLGSGEAIHYNYWSSVWGYGGSRGCLGLPYQESEFLWNWASVGTPVSVHY